MIGHPSIKRCRAEDLKPGDVVYVSGSVKPLYKMTTGILLVVSDINKPPVRRITVLLSNGKIETYQTSSCYRIEIQ
jgi:hypothetical protein